LPNWFAKFDDSKEELASREVKTEFAALAAAVLERLDDELSIEEQLEPKDLFKLELISLFLPRIPEPKL